MKSVAKIKECEISINVLLLITAIHICVILEAFDIVCTAILSVCYYAGRSCISGCE